MAKTNEELKQLKKEYEEFSKKMIDLSDDELNIVVGGSGGTETKRMGIHYFYDHIVAEDAKVGDYVYVTFDDKDVWYSGEIIKIEEKSYWFFYHWRTYEVRLTGYNGVGCSGVLGFDSDEVTLYRNWQRRWD